jgi:hypothetical protein
MAEIKVSKRQNAPDSVSGVTPVASGEITTVLFSVNVRQALEMSAVTAVTGVTWKLWSAGSQWSRASHVDRFSGSWVAPNERQ